MSLYPSDGGNGGGSSSVYPDTTPGINSWSQFQAISDILCASNNIVGANNVSAVSLSTTSDISGAGNVFVGGYIQATGKIQSPEIQIPNITTPTITTTIETDGLGDAVITTDGGGLTVLNGSAPATINAGSLALTGTGSISGVNDINGQAFTGLVVNPLAGNLNGGAHTISNVGEIDPALIVMPPNSTFTPTYNTGQIYYDGNYFQFSAPISVPLPGAGYGPVNITTNKSLIPSGDPLPSYYRFLSGTVQPQAFQYTQVNPFGYYGKDSGINAWWGASFGGIGSPGTTISIIPLPGGSLQQLIFNYSVIQVKISCSNFIIGTFCSTCDYMMVGDGSILGGGGVGQVASTNTITTQRKFVPRGDINNNGGTLDLIFTLIKGTHYTNSTGTLDFFFAPSGTQQFANIYGSSPPGWWLTWELLGII